MNERVKALLGELEGTVSKLKAELTNQEQVKIGIEPVSASAFLKAADSIKEELKELIAEKQEPSDTELRTQALVAFLKTGDVTHVAPAGVLTKKDPNRAIFGPYVFCTVTKTSGKTVYFIRASDPMSRERTAVLAPDLVDVVKPGKCVLYHDKIVSQWCALDDVMWRDCGRAFNALFRA